MLLHYVILVASPTFIKKKLHCLKYIDPEITISSS